MTDFIRHLVSGNKARYRDDELDVDLDLVYITDQVIVMGYPAAGIESLYRNRREDAKKFLEHRHGKNFWVFNFCPVKENSYPSGIFDGRVSRYPFPDHHAPPLAMLPLVAREIRAWLQGSPDRVAVLHCKAGKGRSGTLACSYLLTEGDTSKSQDTMQDKQAKAAATARAKEVMNAMPSDDRSAEDDSPESTVPPDDDPIQHELLSRSSTPAPTKPNDHLTQILDLHASRRMKQDGSASKVAQGVSIPSQRRWLYYWSLLLAHQGPPGLWELPEDAPHPKVRLTGIRVRMRELSGVKTNLVRAATALLDRTSAKGGPGRGAASAGGRPQVWASLARYEDAFVGTLERWERHTRAEDGNMGRRRAGSEVRGAERLTGLFGGAKWDGGKMVRGFARLGCAGAYAVRKEDAEDGRLVAHELQPLNGDGWAAVRDAIRSGAAQTRTPGSASPQRADSKASSFEDVSIAQEAGGVVVDAHREVRVKLFMGQVFMGWFWFIPAFHMPHPRRGGERAKLTLTRKEIDFPLGIGSSIIDVEVAMEWCPESEDGAEPAALQEVSQPGEGPAGEPAGMAATLQSLAAGDLEELVSAKQAAED